MFTHKCLFGNACVMCLIGFVSRWFLSLVVTVILISPVLRLVGKSIYKCLWLTILSRCLFILSQLQCLPGGYIYHWHPIGVEGGERWTASFTASFPTSYNSWEHYLSHGRWSKPWRNPLLGSNHRILESGWDPCCWETRPCSCCHPKLNHCFEL